MEMSFAQALNEAKQVIVQQSNRIKADAEKVKQLQQTIIDQCSTIQDHEAKLKDRAAEIARQLEQIESLDASLAKATVAREQAEAVIDRQGQRITSLQQQADELERRLAEMTDALTKVTAERDEYRAEMPTQDDEEALAAMAALLTTKKAGSPNMKMRLAEDSVRAEAA
jgi:chromosome segregation ATPase